MATLVSLAMLSANMLLPKQPEAAVYRKNRRRGRPADLAILSPFVSGDQAAEAIRVGPPHALTRHQENAKMPRKSRKPRWLDKPDGTNHPAAQSYLALLCSPKRVKGLIKELRTLTTSALASTNSLNAASSGLFNSGSSMANTR